MKNTPQGTTLIRRWKTASLLAVLVVAVTCAAGLWRWRWNSIKDNCAAGWKIRIVYQKLAGHLPYIGWPDVWRQVLEPCYEELNPSPQQRVHHLDDKLINGRKCELDQTALGKFWVPAPGAGLLAFLLWEITVQVEYESREVVIRPGDTVIDCGAHVGVFSRYVLQRGARRVVAIEPAPTNLACLRANLAPEIADGRVTVVPAGVWDKKTRLTLFEASEDNSGGDSFVNKDQPTTAKVEGLLVLPLDEIVEQLHLDRVDFIKMDIEGAERFALRGASQTIGRFKPRMAICAYHLPDDANVIPTIVWKDQPTYQIHAKDIYIMAGRVNTKVLFFH